MIKKIFKKFEDFLLIKIEVDKDYFVFDFICINEIYSFLYIGLYWYDGFKFNFDFLFFRHLVRNFLERKNPKK